MLGTHEKCLQPWGQSPIPMVLGHTAEKNGTHMEMRNTVSTITDVILNTLLFSAVSVSTSTISM